jgi:micrococcal nuclease
MASTDKLPSEDWVRNATVERVVDGDTLDLVIDLGFKITYRERFRVLGLDTPEIYGIKKALAGPGRAASAFVKKLLADPKVIIRSHKSNNRDKYGRYLVEVELADGRDLAKTVIEAGHGKDYDGGSRATKPKEQP